MAPTVLVVSSQPAPETLALEGVSVIRQGRYLLHKVDWVVRDDERWVVIGPNGAGKTTLLQVASTYMTPSRGVMRIFGYTRGGIDVRPLRKQIGYAGAGPAAMFHTDLPAREIVVTGRHAAFVDSRWHDYSGEDWADGAAMMDRLGVLHLANRTYGTLSAGEKQRVALARSLMARPRLLLLDEATTGLDLGARETLLGGLSELATDLSSPPMVMVTHHVEEIPPGFTHALLIGDGEVVAAGPIAVTLTASALTASFDMELALEVVNGRFRAWAP